MRLINRQRFLLGSAGIATAAIAPIVTQTPAAATTMTSQDHAEIINTINKIALLSDRRDWEAVKNCFTEQVEFDYTSLNGGEPASTLR